MATEKDFLVKSSVVAPTSLQVGSATITSSGTSVVLPANSTVDDGAGGSVTIGSPDLTGYATENYVDTAVGAIDLSGYVTTSTIANYLTISSFNSQIASYTTTTDINNALALKANTSSLATVATSGNYNDLSNTPSLASYATQTYVDNAVANYQPTMRNLIINGDMRIAQRGTSETGITTSGYFTVDRWRMDYSGLGTWTQSQSTDVPTGQGFANSLKMDCTTADASPAAGDYLSIRQSIEGQNLQHLKYGTSSAESMTLSFWVKSNKTGTYNVMCLQDDNAIEMLTQAYTINTADTWEKKTLTIVGDVDGIINDDNGAGLRMHFYLGAGSDRTSGSNHTEWSSYLKANEAPNQVNLADSTSNYINITGVQLEVGDTATPFEHRPYDMEFQRCIRYFRTVGDGMIGRSSGTDKIYFSHHFETPMREIPQMSLATTTIRWGNFYSYDKTSAGAVVGLPRSSINAVVGWITGYTGLTSPDMMQAWQNNPPGWLYCDAEL